MSSMKSRLRRLLPLALVLPLLFALGLYAVAGLFLRPSWYVPGTPQTGLPSMESQTWAKTKWHGITHDPRTDLGLDYKDVAFPTEGGATLRAWLVPGLPDRMSGMITVHGGGVDRRNFLRHVPVFHEAGYPVLLFDCREHGISDGQGRGLTMGVREAADVSAAVRYVKGELHWAHAAVIGTSQGGGSVILAAARDPAIDAVIAESPFAERDRVVREIIASRAPAWLPGFAFSPVSLMVLWRMGALGKPSPIDVVDRIAPRPLLLMHGTGDDLIPYQHAERLYARAGNPKELWLQPGAAHSAVFDSDPQEFRRRVVPFLHQYLDR